jgi:Ca-activated chloride channel family protein
MPQTPEIVIITEAEMERWIESGPDAGPGAMVTDNGPLPLKALDVTARIEGLATEVSLTQSFFNNHDQPLEAIYIFPLPSRAAVTQFRLEVAGRVVEGVLRERGQARQAYDEAMAAGHRAAITEEERPGVFTIRVGNLPPRETAVVRLTMVGPLVVDSGEATFRFPLVVAPRYIPGNPLEGRSVGDGVAFDTDAVPDASRISPPVLLPGYPYPVQFSMNVTLHPAALAVSDFKSSLHAVAVQQGSDGTICLRVQPGERLNRDFILRYRIGTAALHSSLLLAPDSAGDEGTYLLTVLPPLQSSAGQSSVRPRSVVFVLDRSGSMEGWKMVAARRALGRMIDTLVDGDRFTVVTFDTEIEMPPAGEATLLVATNRQRYQVIEWLAGVDARGGTELAAPLLVAATLLDNEQSAERVVVLLTDGQVGNEDQILRALAQRSKGYRIFTLGIDRAVNEAFLKRLAALGGGSCDLVESEDRLDEVMDKVNRRIGTPVLTGLHLEPVGLMVDVDSQVPRRLPDLFPGVPLTVMGRYKGQGRGAMILHATDDAGQSVQQTIAAGQATFAGLAPIWARGRLRDLEDTWVADSHTEGSPLQLTITELSLRFGVLCRFTAFLAVDRSDKANKGEQILSVIQPVEPPAGWPMAARLTKASRPASAMPHNLQGGASLRCQASGQDMGPDDSDTVQSQYFGRLGSSFTDDSNDMEVSSNGGDTEALASLGEEEDPVFASGSRWPDLAPYRRRALDILQMLKNDSDPLHGFGVLAVQLKALLDDLESIGANPAETEPLNQLLVSIKGALVQGRQSVVQQLDETRRLLGAFAGGAVTGL